MSKFPCTNFRYLEISLLLLICFHLTIQGANKKIKSNNWEISYQPSTHTIDYSYKGQNILKGTYVKAKVNTTEIRSCDFKTIEIQKEKISDKVGKGKKYTIIYTDGPLSNIKIEQNYYFYPDNEYFLTEAWLCSANEKIASNYIAPVYTSEKNSFYHRTPPIEYCVFHMTMTLS